MFGLICSFLSAVQGTVVWPNRLGKEAFRYSTQRVHYKQLVARLEAWSESLGEPAPPTTSTPVEMTDPQTQEQLRALGYIE